MSYKIDSYNKFINENKRVNYSAIILDKTSKNKLLNIFANNIPEGWKIFAHHMTIAFARGLESVDRADDLNKIVDIKVIKLGISNKAIAVEVEGYPSLNKISHITLAVNTKDGGTPVMSNNIKDWKKVSSIQLKGKVTEIK
jgi:hypothetical protein